MASGNKNKKPKWLFFTSRGAHRNCAIMLWRCYTLILLEISRRTRWWCLKCVIVYLSRDIRPFVMYCVNGKPRSSLLIESTDSIIIIYYNRENNYYNILMLQHWGEQRQILH